MGIQRLVLLVVVVSLPLFFSVSSSSLSENLRRSFFSASKPVFLAGETLSHMLSDAFASLRRIFFVYQENEKLKKEIDILESEITRFREQEKENERLTSLLAFRQKTPYRSIACRVVAHDTTHLSHWIELDKGSKDGLRKEMPVVCEGGLVGKIVEVSDHTARAIQVTDVESRASALVQQSRDTGLVTGDGSPVLKMKFLELGSEVKLGDSVVTSGLGGIYPKGLPIGNVEWVSREKNGLYLVSGVKPAVSISKVEEVLCLDYRPLNS